MAKKQRGVRIPWVEDALGNKYDRSEIDRLPHPSYVTPLKCGGCGTRVSVRHGNADEPDGRSSHYFKLDPHTPTCTYDLEQRGKQLVDRSVGTVVRRAGQWRLICPPLESPGTGGHAKGPSAGTAHPGRTGGSGPRATSKQAGQAIASARRIVQLLQDFDQDPEVAEELSAVAPNGTRNIPWAEFCRGRADANQLAQALLDGTTDTIPHAVWGPVSTADAVGRDRDSYVVMYVARNPVHIENRPVRLRVAVRCDRPDWIGATTRSGHVLAYGYWKLFPDDLSRARSKGWIELQLWVKQPWQVARWDTDGTTVDLPKTVVRPSQPEPTPGNDTASPAPSSTRDLPPTAPPEPSTTLPCTPLPPLPAQERQEPVQPAPEPPPDPAEDPKPIAEPSRPSWSPLPSMPPLPPFPPPDPAQDGQRSALGRWLRLVRRRAD